MIKKRESIRVTPGVLFWQNDGIISFGVPDGPSSLKAIPGTEHQVRCSFRSIDEFDPTTKCPYVTWLIDNYIYSFTF